MTLRTNSRGLRTFAIIWFGQLISLFGSGLTSFGLGVWVYQRTGSTTQLSLIFLATALPGVLISPVAGALVDRWDRRQVMIWSDTGAACSTLFIVLLLLTGRLEVWSIYLSAAVNSFLSAFQSPAYSASITLLVPKQHLGRASGMVNLSVAVAQIAAPALASVLLSSIQIEGVIFIDFVAFLFAVGTLLLVQIPKPKTTAREEAGRGSFGSEVAYGWNYLRARSGLMGLLLYIAVLNYGFSCMEVLIMPLVLSFSTTKMLGTVMSICGIGLLIGSIVMSAWGGPQRRMYGLMIFMLPMSAAMLLTGMRASVPFIASVQFLCWFLFPILIGCNQALWQSKVAPEVQGRVFATRQMIGLALRPLAFLSAGPLVDQVFEPLLAHDGALAGGLGQIIGVGPGRGVGLYFIVIGLSMFIATFAVFMNPRVRMLDVELPDAKSAKSLA